MDIVHLEEFENSFVIHFGVESHRINAYTLASTLVSFADAAKTANKIINPGYDVEIVVEALGPGSFKAQIKSVYNGLKNLFSNDTAKTIILGVLAAYIYEKTLAPDCDVKVIVDETQVIIEHKEKTVVIPRQLHDAMKQIEKSKNFKEDISRTIESIEKDEQVKYFGITKDFETVEPTIVVPRSNFPLLACSAPEPEETRNIIEVAELQIKRAILERSKRKWEFVWRGVTISAPVLDSAFFNDFFDHKITIAPGDYLKAAIKIYQNRDPDTGIYSNTKYEIIEVQKHIPRPRTGTLI